MGDGVALTSAAHPRSPWYKRIWLTFWWWLFPPQLNEGSLETIEIESYRPPTPREVEQAFIDVMQARDYRGRRVYLLGHGEISLERAANGLAEIARWFCDTNNKILPEPDARIAALRNLELLARAYRLALEYQRANGG